jgi:hypothetical protein
MANIRASVFLHFDRQQEQEKTWWCNKENFKKAFHFIFERKES